METLKSLLGFDCQSTVVVVPNKDLHSVLSHCFRSGYLHMRSGKYVC